MADGEKRDWSKGFQDNLDAQNGCNYIRWLGNKKKEHGNALLVILVGVNSFCASMDTDLDAEDAIEILKQEQETIAELLRKLTREKKKMGAIRRPDR